MSNMYGSTCYRCGMYIAPYGTHVCSVPNGTTFIPVRPAPVPMPAGPYAQPMPPPLAPDPWNRVATALERIADALEGRDEMDEALATSSYSCSECRSR
jgi:hypothetical protein